MEDHEESERVREARESARERFGDEATQQMAINLHEMNEALKLAGRKIGEHANTLVGAQALCQQAFHLLQAYAAKAVLEKLLASFTCPKCGRTSHNPNDVKHGYCGACHEFTGQPQA